MAPRAAVTTISKSRASSPLRPNPTATVRSARGWSNFARQTRAREPAWHNAPVSSFGDPNARVLIVGLAPGMQGANRTGRPFTGDYAGDLLYATLLEYGFASGTIPGAARRRAHAGRLPHQQRRALRAAAEQAAARRDQYLPDVPGRDHGDDAEGRLDRAARADRPRYDGEGAGTEGQGRALRARGRA